MYCDIKNRITTQKTAILSYSDLTYTVINFYLENKKEQGFNLSPALLNQSEMTLFFTIQAQMHLSRADNTDLSEPANPDDFLVRLYVRGRVQG